MKAPGKGSLLLAEPFMLDPNFKRTVILLTEENEDGCMGFVLTMKAPNLVHEVIDGMDGFDAPLYIGGPVATDTLHFIHTAGHIVENTLEVVDGVYWGGNFESVRALVQQGAVTPDQFRFFLGYSGWSPGQLAEELVEGSWIVHEHATKKHIFGTIPDDLWKNVLTEKGGDFAMMVNFPENPILN